MNSLPVRLFHASLTGIVIAIFITFLVLHVQQRFHTERPKQDIVRVVEREVKKPTPVTPSATYDPNDRDGDGIPNSWETTYSHNPDNAKDAASDFDFDGLTTKQEYDLSVQTGGQYGHPLGKYGLSATTLPNGFASHETTGAPSIISVTLIEAAKNGLTLARVMGILQGETTYTYTNYTYDPFSQKWTRILPPSGVPLSASMVATDVNSQGQVVGNYYSGGYKGFIWNPPAPGSQSGESKQFFLNPLAVSPNSPTPAIPRRISDTGYLLYSIGSPNSTLKAADHRQLTIDPMAGSLTQPTYIDVNDYGEYVGVILNPVTWRSNTFLAIPYGPVFLSALQDRVRDFDATIYGIAAPDVDYTDIQWGEPYTGPNTLDENGNYIGPFVYGSAVDETTQLPVDFRCSLDDSSIWWRDPNNENIWRRVTTNETPAVLNDWGEFAGKFNETLYEDYVNSWYSYDEGGTPMEVVYLDSWSSNGDGVFFFDGSYHLSVTGFNVFGISNDPQILIGSSSPTHLWSDSVIAPISSLLPPSTPVRNAKICDGGLMILQSGNFVKILTPSDDIDGDGMPDDWEQWAMGKARELNPSIQISDIDRLGDLDGDGTNNLGEFLLRSDPNAAPIYNPNGNPIDTRDGIDTDGDLVPNSWECLNGMNYNYAPDAKEDFDRDGYTNLQEFRLQTDPRGTPSYRVREVGPFPDANLVTLSSSATLGDGFASTSFAGLVGENITESVYFHARPTVGGVGQRPACWSILRSDTVGTFTFNPPIVLPDSYPLAQSTTGASLTQNYGNPLTFRYWASPSVEPVSLIGSDHNISSLSNAKFSPSGKYLVATRRMADGSNTAQLIVWKMPTPGAVTFPSPIPLSSSEVILSAWATPHVNDYGYITATGTTTVGGQNLPVLWKINDLGTSFSSVRILPPLQGGTTAEASGISNEEDPVIAGTSTMSGGLTRAAAWTANGVPSNLGTLPGGSYSTATVISRGGKIAGISNVLVGNTLKYQPFVASYDAASTTWKLQAQGEPGNSQPYLQYVNDIGEILGRLAEYSPAYRQVPYLWRHGRAYRLETLIPANSGHTLTAAKAINPNGTILATTWKEGAQMTILLTPDRDTDGDGLPDAYENQHAFDPFIKNNPSNDSDSDELSDIDEFRNGTEPTDPDTDGDGMKDGWEVSWGLLPLDPTDASLDPDKDRVTNLRESQIGTIPTGIYKIETRLTDTQGINPYVLSADDSGRMIHTGPYQSVSETDESGFYVESYSQEHLLLVPATEEGAGNSFPLPLASSYNRHNSDYSEYNYSSESPAYWQDATSGMVHGAINRNSGYYNAYGSWDEEIFYLIPDAASAPNENWWIPWETVESNLRGGTIDNSYIDEEGDYIEDIQTLPAVIDEADTVFPYADAVSPSGIRRIHQTAMGQRLVLDQSGGFIGNLPASRSWQKIDDNGRGIALTTRRINAANGLPTYYAPELQLMSSGFLETIPIPHEPGVSPNYALQRFSNDGKVLLTRSVKNAQLVSITQFHLFDLNTRTLSRVLRPGIGSESIASLSNENGHLLGTGPKPFQITQDGTCIRLEALRIKGSPNASLLQLSDPSLYPRTLTPNHIASDGRITLTTTNASSQRIILQIVPFNDGDNDGVPDDWELANSITDGAGDQDGDGLSDAGEFANGGDPFKVDTDGDGMNDGVEHTAGFDIADSDENHNRQNDGYEDFDDDGYINRVEALCGTDARLHSHLPDGTDYSMVLHGGGGSGGAQRVLFVPSPIFVVNETRNASFDKAGFREFMSQTISRNEAASTENQGDVESELQTFPKYYLQKATEVGYEYSNDIRFFDNGQPDGRFRDSGHGNGTMIEKFEKEGSLYAALPPATTGSWHSEDQDNEDPPSIDGGNLAPDAYIGGGLPEFGPGEVRILSPIVTSEKWRTNRQGDSSEYSPEFYSIWTEWRNGSMTQTLASEHEHTDSLLIEDLKSLLALNGYQPFGWSVSAYYTWEEDHTSADMQDVQYHAETSILAPTNIHPDTRVVFQWKETFKAQNDGLTKTEWINADGALTSPGRYATEPKELLHPREPGEISPQVDVTGIKGPSVLAAINPGETELLDEQQTDANAQETTRRIVQRGEAIQFQTSLADQKSEVKPMLTAIGTGKVTLWEKKKDGQWQSHALPFEIPAEQAAGPSSDPGSYMLQGTTAGLVTLAIKVGNDTRGNSLDLNVIRVDLDIDSDNSGDVNLSSEEEKIESDTSKPRKIILLNSSSDDDGDEVPNFADFDHAGKFTKIIVKTENLLLSDKISFTYSASDPYNMEQVTNEEGKDNYYPAPGLLRIWKKDGDTLRGSSDFIESGVDNFPDDLGITSGQTAEFFVEAVGNASGIVNIEIKTGTRSDVILVHLAKMSLEMVLVDEEGNLTKDEDGHPANYKGLPSLVAPRIEGTAAVTNLMMGSDGMIFATIGINGTITSKACDMVHGAAGDITDASVILNGQLQKTGSGELTIDDRNKAMLPVLLGSVTQGTGPFRYKRQFSYSKQLENYQVIEGINVISILCKDPVTRLDGSLDIAFTLDVTEDANGISHASISNAPEIVRQTTIGEINPYYLKVAGLDGLEDQIAHFKTQMAPDGQELKMFLDPDKNMILVEDPNKAGEPLATFLKPRIRPESGPARNSFIDEDDAAMRLLLLKNVAGDIGNDIFSFQKGYLAGLYDGGADMVTGVGDVCVGAWDAGKNAMGYIGSTMSVGWYKLTGDEEAENSAKFNMNMFMEDQDPYVEGACRTAKLLGEFYLYVEQTKADALLAAISTSIFEFNAGEAAKSRLTATHDKVSIIAAEVFEMISEEFKKDNVSAYEIGHAYGRVSFEVISFIATLPVVELTIATKLAALTKLAEACELIQGAAKTRWLRVIARIRTWITEIATTKMCFVAGTLVATAHGMTPIEQIRPGDLVWSKPESGNGVVELRPVIQTFVTHPHELWKLTYYSSQSGSEDETITGTAQHPFWAEEAQKFIPMGELKVGMKLRLLNGHAAEIVGLEKTRGPPNAKKTTYNFEVDEFHTYFVGRDGIWVHNSGREACEKIFSIYRYMRKNRVGNGIQETPFQTFIHMLETLKNSSNPGHNQLADTAFDFAKGKFNGRAIRFALKAINDDMYALAASGQFSWRQLPKISEFSEVTGKFRGLGSWRKPSAGDMHKHHLLEGRYFERIKNLISSNPVLASADDLPAFIVEQTKHTGVGGIAPELTKAIGNSNNPLVIKNAHLEVYRKLGMEDARSVFLTMWNDLGLP